MTVALSGQEVAKKLTEKLPGCVIESRPGYVLVKNDSLPAVAAYLKDTPELAFNFLNYLVGVDYYTYFEVVYQLTSLEYGHSLVLKVRCHNRENPVVPSVVGLWQGADFQEREVYDLMGIKFEGHPNMKRIFLWEGFEGHPLRKDYL